MTRHPIDYRWPRSSDGGIHVEMTKLAQPFGHSSTHCLRHHLSHLSADRAESLVC